MSCLGVSKCPRFDCIEKVKAELFESCFSSKKNNSQIKDSLYIEYDFQLNNICL